jgi:hypothetical protein
MNCIAANCIAANCGSLRSEAFSPYPLRALGRGSRRPGMRRQDYSPLIVFTTLSAGRLVSVGSLFSLSTASSNSGSVASVFFGTM